MQKQGNSPREGSLSGGGGVVLAARDQLADPSRTARGSRPPPRWCPLKPQCTARRRLCRGGGACGIKGTGATRRLAVRGGGLGPQPTAPTPCDPQLSFTWHPPVTCARMGWLAALGSLDDPLRKRADFRPPRRQLTLERSRNRGKKGEGAEAPLIPGLSRITCAGGAPRPRGRGRRQGRMPQRSTSTASRSHRSPRGSAGPRSPCGGRSTG